MGRLLRVATEHLRALTECEDQHMKLQSKQPIDTEHFTEVVKTTEFQKATCLDLRQQREPYDAHVPPLQLFKPSHLAQQLRSGRRQKRHGHSDNPDEGSKKASKPSGPDETMTTEINDATSAPKLTTETPDTSAQPSPQSEIFDEGTTSKTTLSQMFERSPATRRKAQQLHTPSMRTCLITQQPPRTLTDHADAVEHAESQAVEDRGSCERDAVESEVWCDHPCEWAWQFWFGDVCIVAL